jgi:hypothetical protein
MPIGVYERKPWMGNAGKTRGQREYVLGLRAEGVGQRTIAKLFGWSKATVQRLEKGEWNSTRKPMGKAREPGVLRESDWERVMGTKGERQGKLKFG